MEIDWYPSITDEKKLLFDGALSPKAVLGFTSALDNTLRMIHQDCSLTIL